MVSLPRSLMPLLARGLVLLVLLASSSCGGGGSGGPTIALSNMVPVSIALKVPGQLAAGDDDGVLEYVLDIAIGDAHAIVPLNTISLLGVKSVMISISGAGFATQFDEFDAIAGQQMVRSFQVLEGTNRTFDIKGYNAAVGAGGVITYTGSTVVNLTANAANAAVPVDIPMVATAAADVLSPVITLPAATLTVAAQSAAGTPATQAAIAAFFTGVSAVDNVGIIGGISNTAPAIFPLGVTNVLFSATDDSANTGLATATINITDQTAPSIALNGLSPVTVEAGSVYNDALATMADNVDATDTALAGVSNVDSALLGNYSVIYDYTDAGGNVAGTVARIVNVVDTTAPTLTLPADVAVEAIAAQTAVTLGLATATDFVDAAPTVTNNAPVSGTYPVGTTVVTWTATDANNNVATGAQNIVVADTIAPTLIVPVDVNVEATATLSAIPIGTATATDTVDPNPLLSNDAPITGTYPVGTTIVTWTATDANNNSVTKVQNIVVNDTTAPTVTAPAAITITAETAQGTAISAAIVQTFLNAASATDLVDGVILPSHDAPALFLIGTTTTVTFSATDTAGFTTTATSTVTVTNVITGVSAAGLPVVSAVMNFTGANGVTHAQAVSTHAADGSYAVTLPATMSYPILLKVTRLARVVNGVSSIPPALYSLAANPGINHATMLTTMVTAEVLNAANGAQIETNFAATTLTPITAETAVTASMQNLRTLLGLTAATLLGAKDALHELGFVADGTGLDAVMDALYLKERLEDADAILDYVLTTRSRALAGNAVIQILSTGVPIKVMTAGPALFSIPGAGLIGDDLAGVAIGENDVVTFKGAAVTKMTLLVAPGVGGHGYSRAQLHKIIPAIMAAFEEAGVDVSLAANQALMRQFIDQFLLKHKPSSNLALLFDDGDEEHFGDRLTRQLNGYVIVVTGLLRTVAPNAFDPIAVANAVWAANSDTVNPVITLKGLVSVTIAQHASYNDAGASAVDNNDGQISDWIEINNAVDTSALGTYTVTYNVRDTAGNQAIAVSRTVLVVASSVPTTVSLFRRVSYAWFLDQGSVETLDVGVPDAAVGALTYAVSVNPAQGSASINGSGRITYTPLSTYVGNDTFSVTATDSLNAVFTLVINAAVLSTAVPPLTISTIVGDAADDYLGWSVADAGDVNGDGFDDVIVGAYLDDNNGTDSGSAFIFYGPMNTLPTPANASQADVVISGDAAGDRFSYNSVASAGDVNNDGFSDVIVGAYYDDNNGVKSGSVFIFYGGSTLVSGAASTVASIVLLGDNANDRFGRTVASAGDVNQDGFADVIVGADGDDNNGSGSGSAFIFYGGTTLLSGSASLQAAVVLNGDASLDAFGWSVAGAGDVNNDTYADVMIGAYKDDNNGADSGSVFIFHGGPTLVSGSASLKAAVVLNGDAAGDWLGYAIAGAGDVNGDATADVMIGAYKDDNNGTSSGSVFVFYGGGSLVTGTASVVANVILTGSAGSDFFGKSLDGAGDVNNDGFSDMIVGAYGTDNNGSQSGSAFIFLGGPTLVSGTAAAIAKTRLDGDVASDNFGRFVAAAGDVNADGFADIIVGAYLNDSNGVDAGMVRIYTDPLVRDDSDNDGLFNANEIIAGTNPNLVDSDGDGLSDWLEIYTYGSDPLLADTDGDGLNDGLEVNTHGTNPLLTDSDGDGLSDADELNIYDTNPALADSDGDGLSDGFEVFHALDPLAYTGDGDGIFSATELLLGSDPLSAASRSTVLAMLGQTDGQGIALSYAVPDAGGSGDTHAYGLQTIQGIDIDPLGHRLFVADQSNSRIVVFQLDANNAIASRKAIHVLGQVDFSHDDKHGGATAAHAAGLNTPESVNFYDDGIKQWLLVSDSTDDRVMIYDITQGITDGMAASKVLGQSSFTGAALGLSTTKLSGPRQARVLSFGSKRLLFVADKNNNRTMVWDVSLGLDALANGQAADTVLGQGDFTSKLTALGIRSQQEPVAVAQWGNVLFVSDALNNRVIAYDLGINAVNLVTGMAATYVLGQASFFATGAATTTASALNYPGYLDVSGDQLFVADDGNNRVLVYNLTQFTAQGAAANGMNAVYVFGQTNFTLNATGVSQNTLDSPWGLVVSNNTLYVGDVINDRIVSYDLSTLATDIATATYAPNALNLIGQTNQVFGMADGAENIIWNAAGTNDTGATGFTGPRDAVLATVQGTPYLFVADGNNNRVLGFAADNAGVPLDMQADVVLGQPNFDVDKSGLSSLLMDTPRGVAFDNTALMLFVSDSSNNRILAFDLSAGVSNGQAATAVFGQSGFTTNATDRTQSTLNNPRKIVVGTVGAVRYLFVVDRLNDRVLAFNLTDGVASGELAAHVLGGPDFITNASGADINQLSNPYGVDFDVVSQRLFVGDGNADRVLVWDLSGGIVDGMDAVNILGQTTVSGTGSGLSASKFNWVYDVAFDVSRDVLWVVDNNNNRVVGFDVANGITDGMNASYVLGQQDLVSRVSYVGDSRTAFTMNDPIGITVGPTGNIIVAEFNDDRVVVFGGSNMTNLNIAMTTDRTWGVDDGSSIVVTATVTDQIGALAAGIFVDVSTSGSSSPGAGRYTTDARGQIQFNVSDLVAEQVNVVVSSPSVAISAALAVEFYAAAADADADGFTNTQEFAAYSDPLVASSVPNTAPVFTFPTANPYAITTTEDTPVSFSVTALDADADLLSYVIYPGANNGYVAINSSGALVYTPNANFNGSDSFTIHVGDSRGGSASTVVNMTITALNDAPVAEAIAGPQVSTSFQQGVSAYFNTQDTELRQNTPAVNLGTAITLSVDGDAVTGASATDDTNALLQFNYIVGLSAQKIPQNARIVGATLQLFVVSGGHDVDMVQMLSAWDESSATWDSHSAVVAGGTYLRTLIGRPTVGSLLDLSGVSQTFDVSPEVQSWVSGGPNFGWAFAPADPLNNWDGVDFRTKESTSPPLLTVQYIPTELMLDQNINKAVTLAGSDVDGDALSAKITTLPISGKLFQTTDGIALGAEIVAVPTLVSSLNKQVIFVPNVNFIGSDSFMFKVNDGVLDSAAVTMVVHVTGADTFSLLSAPSWLPNDGTQGMIVLEARDGLGAVYPGVTVNFVTGGSAVLSAASGQTNASGLAAVDIADAVAETATVIASAPSLLPAASINVNVDFLYAAADQDGDGLSNTQEYVLGTDPFNIDSDGDGASDFHEQAAGTDPNSIAVFPTVGSMIWDNVTTGVWDQSYWAN